MDAFKATVAENIIRLRTRSGMTQAQLGEKLNYSDKSISKWERAEALPDAYVLKRISEIFEVSVDYILTKHPAGEKAPMSFLGIGRKYSRKVITTIAIISIFTVAFLAFIIVWLCGSMDWLILAYAVPVALVTWLVLNSTWRMSRVNLYLVSALAWSIIALIYFTFLQYNWWQLFLFGIPVEILIILSFRVKINRKK